jgi:hypothetical protein
VLNPIYRNIRLIGLSGLNSDLKLFTCSSLLGGLTEGRSIPFMSRNALNLIYEEILRKLVSFIQDSTFSWVHDAASVLSNDAEITVDHDSSLNIVEMAKFSLEILDGSFFCLKTLDREGGIVSGILSAIFVIEWECNLSKSLELEYSLDDKSMTKAKARQSFGEYVCAFHNKINAHFLKSLCRDNRRRMLNFLIQSVKSAIFVEDRLVNDGITSLCCTWVLELLERVCVDESDELNLLHQLLSQDERWPVFVVQKFSSTKVFTHLVICLNLIDSFSGICTLVYMIVCKVQYVGLCCYLHWDINVNIGK